jgi:hypothetical protein
MDDPLEEFRKNFFGMLEKEKLEKEKVLKEKQRTCWHNLVLVNSMKICKKCGKISK